MKCIVIGSSTGGPEALDRVLGGLPKNLNAIVIVVQHISDSVARSMARRMDEKHPISISIIENDEKMETGHVYVVPGASHFFMITPKDSEVVAKLLSAHERPSPSVDMAFTSVAEHFGENTIGVILTGMGEDGTVGAKAIKQFGGVVIAQDEETSVVFGMPRRVAEEKLVDHVFPIENIAGKLISLTK